MPLTKKLVSNEPVITTPGLTNLPFDFKAFSDQSLLQIQKVSSDQHHEMFCTIPFFLVSSWMSRHFRLGFSPHAMTSQSYTQASGLKLAKSLRFVPEQLSLIYTLLKELVALAEREDE